MQTTRPKQQETYKHCKYKIIFSQKLNSHFYLTGSRHENVHRILKLSGKGDASADILIHI